MDIKQIVLDKLDEFSKNHPGMTELLVKVTQEHGVDSFEGRNDTRAENCILGKASKLIFYAKENDLEGLGLELQYTIEDWPEINFREINEAGDDLLKSFYECLIGIAEALDISYERKALPESFLCKSQELPLANVDNTELQITGTTGTSICNALEYWEINSALRGIIKIISMSIKDLDFTKDANQWWEDVRAGINPEDSGWWEAVSHGLVQAFEGRIDKGFYDLLQDLSGQIGLEAAYIQLETDFLRFDEKGYDRKYYENYPKPIELHKASAQTLFLRVTAFTKLRTETEKLGTILPDNPVLDEAKKAVMQFLRTNAQPIAVQGMQGIDRNLKGQDIIDFG